MNGAEEFPQEMPAPKGAKLWEMMQLSINGVEESAIIMPPPLREASLLVMVQLVMLGEEVDPTVMPPPEEAELLVMMQLVMVGEELVPIRIPPPFPDVEPLVIVKPSRVELLSAEKVTTLPEGSPSGRAPSIKVDSGPFTDLRVMVLLGGKRIFS